MQRSRFNTRIKSGDPQNRRKITVPNELLERTGMGGGGCLPQCGKCGTFHADEVALSFAGGVREKIGWD